MHSACVRCNSPNILKAVHEVMTALASEQARVRRCDHANFAPKSREKITKFPEFRRAARTKSACIRPASAAHTQRNVAEVHRVENAFRFEKARVQRREHANLAPKSREKVPKILKIFGAPRAQKIACTRPVCAATRLISWKLFTKS